MNMTPEKLRDMGYVEIPTGSGNWEKPRFLPPVPGEPEVVHAPVDRERDLHDEICAWAESQWPRVKYVHSRMDRPTGMEAGIADFVLFLPAGRTVCVEAKARDGKLSKEQAAWHKEMSMLGHRVLVVKSLEEMKILIQQPRGKK